MPYTKQEDRKPINPHLEAAAKFIKTPGDLTYAITYLMHLRALAIMQDRNPDNVKPVDSYTLSYQKLSQVRASAADAHDEFYDVVMRPYEDKKRNENGPVSTLDM